MGKPWKSDGERFGMAPEQREKKVNHARVQNTQRFVVQKVKVNLEAEDLSC